MSKRLPLVLALAVLAIYFGVVLHYLFSPNFMDHLEPMVASSSWAFLKGRPLYHEAVSAERYAVLYGPMLYVLTSIPLLLLGPSIFSAKLGAVVATIASFVLLSRALAELRVPRAERLLYLGWLAVAYLCFPSVSYWNRSDPWMLALVTASLLSAQVLSPLSAAIACGVCTGILSGLKLHGAIYALPAFALIYERASWRGLLLASLAAWSAFSAPFLSDSISFGAMIFWIRQTSHHGLSVQDGARVLGWGVCLAAVALPLLPVLLKRLRPTALFWAALFVTLLLASFTGSLKGAGRHHLVPWLPSLVMGIALLVRDSRSLLPGLLRYLSLTAMLSALALSISAYRHTTDQLRDLSRYPGKEIIAELAQIQASRPGSAIEMGYGADYRLSFYRPVLVFKQGDYLLDGAALMDMQPYGLAVMPKTLERIAACDPPVWLFPKGEEPFGLRHLAPPYPPIFDEEIKAEFSRHYRRSEVDRFFSVWTCSAAH